MPTLRNSLPLNFGNVVVQPVPPQPAVTAQTAVAVQQQNTRPPTGLGLSVATTTANTPLPTSAISDVRAVDEAARRASPTGLRVTTETNTNLSPIRVLAGTAIPFLPPPVVVAPRPNPVRLITEQDTQEETLTLDTYTVANGTPVQTLNSLRCDLVSLMNFTSVWDNSGNNLTRYGEYLNDLNQSSMVRDTLRKFIVVNKARQEPDMAGLLESVGNRVAQDIESSRTTLQQLDGLLGKVADINRVLDVKAQLESTYVFRNPYQALPAFFTSRMLFSEQAYRVFSDTKVLYQLLFDLTGMLDKCSFNLLSGFTDYDRTVFVQNPRAVRKQTVQDAVTLDLTYGDELRYTSSVIRGKYVTSFVTYNSITTTLPTQPSDRFKFITNLLSRELRVSHGLGRFQLQEAGFFGFRRQGNPFDNVVGTVPSDIFSEPTGQNSLSTLFYLRTSAQNAVVLPFENRQVVSDNETVFVPGSAYFSDGLLKGNFSIYNSYREQFSSRITNAKTVFDRLLLQQDTQLKQDDILKVVVGLFEQSVSGVRAINNDPTTIASVAMFVLAASNPTVKFELFKFLLLLCLYDTRASVAQTTSQVDRFKELLLGELGGQTLQGLSSPVTEESIATLITTQLATLKSVVLENIPEGSNLASAQESNNTTGLRVTSQAVQLGMTVPEARPDLVNPSNNIAQVPVRHLDQLVDSLRSTGNLFKAVVVATKNLFAKAAGDEDVPAHLVEGTTATRMNSLTLSSMLQLVLEMFVGLSELYLSPNVTTTLVDGAGIKSRNTQLIQVGFVSNAISSLSDNMTKLVAGVPYTEPTLQDIQTKLGMEDDQIANILMFFDRLNQQLSNVVAPSQEELAVVAEQQNMAVATTLGGTRTSKGILRSIEDKQRVVNPSSNQALNFYLPAGRVVSDADYKALLIAAKDRLFVGGKKKVATVGVPYGFVNAALGAGLNKADAYTGRLQEQPTDIAKVNLYRLNKNDEGVIFKPQSWLFDLSLFPKGFNGTELNDTTTTLEGLHNLFQFYDFDEDEPYSQTGAKTVASLAASDVYYSLSADRQELASTVTKNLLISFLVGLYGHLTTGLNLTEETFIKYTQRETDRFVKELRAMSTGVDRFDASKTKLMSAEYAELLSRFVGNSDDLKLMLTLCNDIRASVFREKEYDRVLNVLFDVDEFPVDVEATNSTDEGKGALELLYSSGRLYEGSDGQTYKVGDEFKLDQYFITVELVQQ